MVRGIRTRILLSLFLLLCPTWSHAQSASEFYKGRTIFLQIGSGSGGGYDIIGRLFARFMGPHIAGNPRIVPQNVPGGGSLALANNFANIVPRDGSVFGIFNTGMILTPLLTPSVVKYDPRKFKFIGAPAREAHVLIAWHTAPITNIEDVFKREIIVGATAPGGAPFDYPLLTNELLGTKFRVVTGYRSSHESRLAMERGEVHALAGHGWASVKSDFVEDIATGRIRVIAAFGMQKHHDLPNIPLFPIGSTEEERQLFNLMYSRQITGRPFMAPPDVPQDRLDALRRAFKDTMKDKVFLTDADKLNVDIDPVSYDELERLVTELYAVPRPILDRMQKILLSN